MECSPAEIYDMMVYQIGALQAFVQIEKVRFIMLNHMALSIINARMTVKKR